MWLQGADVFDHFVDLRIAERCAEGRHRAFLAVLDSIAEELVIPLAVHQLRPPPGGATTVRVAPATGRREQLPDIKLVVLRGRSRLLRAQGGDRKERGKCRRRQ